MCIYIYKKYMFKDKNYALPWTVSLIPIGSNHMRGHYPNQNNCQNIVTSHFLNLGCETTMYWTCANIPQFFVKQGCNSRYSNICMY